MNRLVVIAVLLGSLQFLAVHGADGVSGRVTLDRDAIIKEARAKVNETHPEYRDKQLDVKTISYMQHSRSPQSPPEGYSESLIVTFRDASSVKPTQLAGRPAEVYSDVVVSFPTEDGGDWRVNIRSEQTMRWTTPKGAK